MEQNIKEQTSGCHRYSMRCVSGVAGQGACIKNCVVVQGRKDVPLCHDDVTSLVALIQEYGAQKHGAQVRVIYHVASSLSHYGKVDSLVTAGAMADFVDYVYQLEQEEAQKYFASFEKALENIGHNELALHFVREAEDEAKILASLQKVYAKIIICSFL